jgi:hypothetical protein
MLHRCLMCHKHCLIPCKFTAFEFQQKLRDELDSLALDAKGDEDGSVPVKWRSAFGGAPDHTGSWAVSPSLDRHIRLHAPHGNEQHRNVAIGRGEEVGP